MKRITPEGSVMKAVTDLLEAYRIPYWRMNAGNRIGSYASKRTGKTTHWCIRGHQPGTADLLAAPRALRIPGGLWLDGAPSYLWIEVKAPNGRQSVEQEQFEAFVRSQSMNYIVARSSDDVLRWLKDNGAAQ